MHQRRLKAPASFPVAYCHCLSRVVNRDFVLGPAEREKFVRLFLRGARGEPTSARPLTDAQPLVFEP